MINEYFQEALNELKRVDHLVYVSLKYTRTVDMIYTILKRMTNTLDSLFIALIYFKKDIINYEDMPTLPAQKIAAIKKAYPDDSEILKAVEFYQFLRLVLRSKYSKINEYRKKVTMIVHLEEDVLIDMPKIFDYFEYFKQLFDYVGEIIHD